MPDGERGKPTKEKFALALRIVAKLFPGHQHVFDWLVELPTIPSDDDDKEMNQRLWVRVAVTYVVNFGTLLQEMLSLVRSAKMNLYNSEVLFKYRIYMLCHMHMR